MSNRYFDKDRFEEVLLDALEKVNSKEDPFVLNEMKKLFKKNVPFNRRMYVAAYLAKMATFNSRSSYRGRDSYHERGNRLEKNASDYRNRRNQEAHSEYKAPSRRVSIDESVAATLFISIGRNRRVFPRDLVGLLIQVAGIERERIGDIRTLENYSFVQVFKEYAEKIIGALNDYEYRGRKLSVSHSRKKEDVVASDSMESEILEDEIVDSYDAQNSEE